MRETTLVVTARKLSAPILRELAHLLGSRPLPFDSGDPIEDTELHEDDELIRSVWQEVGDDLRDAMREYPVSQAASDAGESLPATTA